MNTSLRVPLIPYDIGSQPMSSFCWRTAPSPCLPASQIIRSGFSFLKCVNSATFFTSSFNILKADSCTSFHSILRLFQIDLKGKQIVTKSGTNLLNWFTAPENDLNSFKLVGLSLSEIPCTFVLIGEMPELVSLKPNHSISCFANLHFPTFNCNFASFITFPALYLNVRS